MRWLWTATALLAWAAHAADATLDIVAGGSMRTFIRSQLLARSDLRTITVRDSVYHQRRDRFKAVPLADLFAGLTIPDGAVIQCNGTDGFSAVLDQRRLLSTDPKASEAMLAIEEKTDPWPSLTGRTTSAGPFYLMWLRPEASSIGREEWPFNVASFHVVADSRALFPAMYPADGASHSVQAGFKSFQKNCFACHKMNGAGAGVIGPDLNIPRNPTEYFDAKALRIFVRDPAQVRAWPAMAMRGFSETAITDEELSDLIAYLHYMSAWKHQLPREVDPTK